MSRSYKKTPIYTDGRNGRKWFKRQANKVIRRRNSVPNGKKYKSYYCSWNIHDYKSRWTKQEAEQEYYKNINDVTQPYWTEYYRDNYKNKEKYLDDHWRKFYYSK